MPKLHHTTQEGWAIHVYDRDRRLLCTVEPSHGWMFVAGLALGLMLAIVGYNLPQTPTTAAPPRPNSDMVAPLQID
ncbi:hypothetical protein [Nodosilinea nodulosa]|uniref:hypothetical protein n=1 Tax=Nodosilinea nodulosa TaxID=416001 RepID=UPI0002FBF3EB|nr:hypothetical protein [Nodosilinea nodulosa]